MRLYPDGFGGKVALRDHQVPRLVQFDDGPSIGLYLCLESLVFLELPLWTDIHCSMSTENIPPPSRCQLLE